MKLPTGEERNEKMMRVVKSLEMFLPLSFESKVDHDTQESEHRPTSDSWPRSEVDLDVGEDSTGSCRRENDSETPEIDEMCDSAARQRR